MIDFEDARKIALNFIGEDLMLSEDHILEKGFGWYFSSEPKKRGRLLAGRSGFIVDRETGKIFECGSAFPVERDLKMYELGYRFKSYDLTILAVSNLEKTVELLHKLQMQYVVPEFEHGVNWKIPREYKPKEIRKALKRLPFTFEGQRFYFRLEDLERLKQANCCSLELKGAD